MLPNLNLMKGSRIRMSDEVQMLWFMSKRTASSVNLVLLVNSLGKQS